MAPGIALKEIEKVTIRFAGDSGDGMQVTGDQFSHTSALMGNDISTLPDFPAEIRAPTGTLPGVSGFQLNFSSREIRTSGDTADVLVVMNPAALVVNKGDLRNGGMIIANTDAFLEGNLKKIGLTVSPLDDGSLKDFMVIRVPLNQLVQDALKELDLRKPEIDRCKNFFALGLVYWLFDRDMTPTQTWIRHKFGKKPHIAEANLTALKAGYIYGDVSELFQERFQVNKAPIQKGVYRKISGNEGLVLGLITGSLLSRHALFYGAYPITPSTDILHYFARYKNFQVKTFQAEDEIAAVGAAIGACFAGHLGVTGTSGPGLCLKAESINLAVMTELPLIVINVQRGGPSTGLPTKPEQADLLQALWGRNGESPVALLAPQSPSDCFQMALEAVRIATKYMVPVIVLSDGYIANSAEPWKIPDESELPTLNIHHRTDPEGFYPYLRDPETLARPWVLPGTPGLEHRIGGLEKSDTYGSVCYDPENHQHMCETRQKKVLGIAKDIPETVVSGPVSGELLVIGWGGTYGAIASAVELCQAEGLPVSSTHIRYLNPFPRNLESLVHGFDKILVPEMNLGQLNVLLRNKFGIRTIPYYKIKGRPFLIQEIVDKIKECLAEPVKRVSHA